MSSALTRLAVVAFLGLATAAAGAEPRFKTGTEAEVDQSIATFRKSLSAADLAQLSDDLKQIAADAMCPMDTEHPDMRTLIAMDDAYMKLVADKTAGELHALAARVLAARETERAGMRELPLESDEAKALIEVVEKYFKATVDATETYTPLLPYWTAERLRVAEMRQAGMVSGESLLGVPPPKAGLEPAHRRQLSALGLFGADILSSFKVSRIVASPTKAYVYVGRDSASLRSTYLQEDGVWKAHADVMGYPWSRDGYNSPECVGILKN